MSKFILISKDAMCTDYLSVYGNCTRMIPNIIELANKGTIFKNYYVAAPSTVMSFYSMVTGKYGHETKYEMYERMHDVYHGETLFTKLKNKGYENHIIWDDEWMILLEYFNYYKNDVEIHNISGFGQKVGSHFIHDGYLKPDEKKQQETYEKVTKQIKKILEKKDNIFLWIHFPHVINGQTCYGSDIELFDRYVGYIRTLISDDCIAITADHGNMNGHKGKVCYAYDVYQPAIRIPLITPRINGQFECLQNCSSVDLYSIIFEHKVPVREYVYSDTAYKAQKHRKLAIIYDKYKYIYNKQNGTEELYDLYFDPCENFSLIEDYIYDFDRKINVPSRELYFYPEWDKLPEIRKKLRKEKDRIWQNGSIRYVLKSNAKDLIRPIYERLTREKLNV